MLMPRGEFHRRRSLFEFRGKGERIMALPLEPLYQELRRDAPYRGHAFMFDPTVDLTTLPVQEKTEGIMQKFPDLQTEADRYDKIHEELLAGTYEPVQVIADSDFPSVTYIDNGLHRVYIAHAMGLKEIMCRVQFGKFLYTSSISFGDLAKLLGMLELFFPAKYQTFSKAREILERAVSKKTELNEHHSIVYGHDKGDE